MSNKLELTKENIEIVDKRCEEVLKYILPNYKKLTIQEYENAMEALRTIAFG